MASKELEGQQSIWDSVPKSTQQAIQKELMKLNKQEPSSKPAKKDSSFQLKGYIRCELSTADKEGFKAWESGQSSESLFLALFEDVESGYLLKAGFSNSGFQATMSAWTTGKPWDGFVLTAHAKYATRAAALLVYKHRVMMESDWSAWMADDSEDSIR